MQELNIIHYLLIILAVFSIIFPVLGNRFAVPVFVVVGRWLRWIVFAGWFAFLLSYFELSFRPDWVHFITGLALWFLFETGYNWLAILALSRGEMPLFHSFELNQDGDEWPADKKFIELRDWLRNERFNRITALKAELFEGTYLRVSIYESEDHMTRIQILFLPKRKDGATACYTVSTEGKDDRRLITDNLFLPYGGFYPEGWDIARKPLKGSLKSLLKLHHLRLIKSSITPVSFEEDPLQEMNEQQRILERLNCETGFLVPRGRQEEEGKITYEGRYRLWKEMWMLAYLGKSMT